MNNKYELSVAGDASEWRMAAFCALIDMFVEENKINPKDVFIVENKTKSNGQEVSTFSLATHV